MRAKPASIALLAATALLASCSKIPQVYLLNSLNVPVTVTLSTDDPNFEPVKVTIKPKEELQLNAPFTGPYHFQVASSKTNFQFTKSEESLDAECGGSSMRTCFYRIRSQDFELYESLSYKLRNAAVYLCPLSFFITGLAALVTLIKLITKGSKKSNALHP